MNRSLLLKVSVRYGLVAGVLAFVLVVVMFYLGRHPMMISPFLDFRILLFGLLIFFCLKEVRDYHQNGELYFSQGMIGAGIVVLVATCIASVCLQIFGSWENTFVPQYVELMTAYLKTFPESDIQRIGKDVYERNLQELPATNIAKITVTYFAQGLMIGFFVSIIVSVIVRRQPKT